VRAVKPAGEGGGPRWPRAAPEAPPHDLAVEREVLGSCLVRPELIDGADLAADDFYSSANGLTWSALVQLRKAGASIDMPQLRSHLSDQNLLSAIGGVDYLLDLTSMLPTGAPQFARLRKLARMRAMHLTASQLAIAARAGEDITSAYALVERDKHALDAVDAPPTPHPLERAWLTLETLGALDREPPPRKWLLTRPDDETAGRTSLGVLQLGKVGMLIAAGGAGKTIALVALALAVATGRRWFEYFEVAHPGRVLIALAEEDLEEVQRRFFAIGRAMRLTDAQLALAGRNIVCLPLAGQPVALVDAEGQDSAALIELRTRLQADSASPWRLVILDPLSRFAAADTEKDQAAATRFIQAVESIALAAPGKPSVLVAHHTNKIARTEGLRASASDARGASAITDGARWAANLESNGDDGARFTITKSNYAQKGMPLELVRDGAQGGYLRAATADERRARAAARDTQKSQAAAGDDALIARILAELARNPDQSKSALSLVLQVRPATIGLAVDELAKLGRITLTSKYGYSVTGPGNSPTQGTL
jgi:hypothetical protein